MAVRGIVTTLTFYPTIHGPGVNPLYLFQNHFENPITISSQTYVHNFFEISGLSVNKDSAASEVAITFAATAANVDLVEEAITDKLDVVVGIYRWGPTAQVDNPVTYNFFGGQVAFADSAEADLTTITLKINDYDQTTTADLPWRKIPWTILGPLSFRR